MTQTVVQIIGSFNSYDALQAAVTAGTVTPTSGKGYHCLNACTVSNTLYPAGDYAYNGSAWFRVADKLFDTAYAMGFSGTIASGNIDKRLWLPCQPMPHRTFFLATDVAGASNTTEARMYVFNGTDWVAVKIGT